MLETVSLKPVCVQPPRGAAATAEGQFDPVTLIPQRMERFIAHKTIAGTVTRVARHPDGATRRRRHQRLRNVFLNLAESSVEK